MIHPVSRTRTEVKRTTCHCHSGCEITPGATDECEAAKVPGVVIHLYQGEAFEDVDECLGREGVDRRDHP